MPETVAGQPRPAERLKGKRSDRAQTIRSRVVLALGLRGAAEVDAQELRHPGVEQVKMGVHPNFDPADPQFRMTHVDDFPARGLRDREIAMRRARVVVGAFVNEAGRPYVQTYGARVRVELANVPVNEGLLLTGYNGREVAVVVHVTGRNERGTVFQAETGNDLYFSRVVLTGRTDREFIAGEPTGEHPTVRRGTQDTADLTEQGVRGTHRRGRRRQRPS